MFGTCSLCAVSRAQKISTVVDFFGKAEQAYVSRAQKISTVVDQKTLAHKLKFHALKKFLLL